MSSNVWRFAGLAYWIFVVYIVSSMSWLRLVGLLCALGATFLFVLYRNQEQLLYQPKANPMMATVEDNPVMLRSPSEYDLEFEDVKYTTDDGERIVGWWVPQPNPAASPTLLWFHANAGNMGLRLPNLFLLYQRIGFNVMIISYRGYNTSTGQPSEPGLILDAKGAMQWLCNRKEVDLNSIFIYGRSLGGAVATALTQMICKGELEITTSHPDLTGSDDPLVTKKVPAPRPAGLILENTFTSISDLVDTLFPILRHFKKLILRLSWKTIDRIADVDVPILFLSGREDELVPPIHMDRLSQAAIKAPRRLFFSVQNGTHNDTWLQGGLDYVQTIRYFVEVLTNNPAEATGSNNNSTLAPITNANETIPKGELLERAADASVLRSMCSLFAALTGRSWTFSAQRLSEEERAECERLGINPDEGVIYAARPHSAHDEAKYVRPARPTPATLEEITDDEEAEDSEPESSSALRRSQPAPAAAAATTSEIPEPESSSDTGQTEEGPTRRRRPVGAVDVENEID